MRRGWTWYLFFLKQWDLFFNFWITDWNGVYAVSRNGSDVAAYRWANAVRIECRDLPILSSGIVAATQRDPDQAGRNKNRTFPVYNCDFSIENFNIIFGFHLTPVHKCHRNTDFCYQLLIGGIKFTMLAKLLQPRKLSRRHGQCDQIGRFIGLWATF